MLDLETTVRELALRHPQLLEVFEAHGIDYCCGGADVLPLAAAKRGVALEALLPQLESALGQPLGAEERALSEWEASDLGALADYIERRHHTALRKLLPEAGATLATVTRVHAARHGELLHGLADLLHALHRDIEAHLATEEQVVFPAIKQCAGRCRTGGAATEGEVELRDAILDLIAEHEEVGAVLHELHARTSGYTLPDDACPTFARLYRGLEELEHDLHRHVHLENNLLLPRALELTHCHDES